MAKTNEKGIIIKIAGPVVDVRFENEVPQINEALIIRLDNKETLTLEVAFAIGDKEVKALALGSTDGLSRGMEVERTGAPISVPVGEITLGRIFNVLGQTIDDQKPLEGKDIQYEPIHKAPPALIDQQTKPELLETGIKVIDLIAPFTKGGKVAIFGGAGVGKTVIVKELIRN
ncbi:MAG TPA: F0F1 ATP synthase subunit beta, partial [Candidatus Saccharimonadales bacterium]|nr:F0F1 ATP synthase subunit beta [Candidatus Saccharimonadales bacterium]